MPAAARLAATLSRPTRAALRRPAIALLLRAESAFAATARLSPRLPSWPRPFHAARAARDLRRLLLAAEAAAQPPADGPILSTPEELEAFLAVAAPLMPSRHGSTPILPPCPPGHTWS